MSSEKDKAATENTGGNQDDTVGYGKPPKASQFKKGRSGNPRGRPRKPKPVQHKLADGTYETFFEDEAFRMVRVTENGKTLEMPVAQAIHRRRMIGALQGSRLQQKDVLKELEQKEQKAIDFKIQRYIRLEKIKRDGERTLADSKAKGISPPELIPHPDDIELRPNTGEVILHGPETIEEVRHWEAFTRIRDYLLRCAAWECKGADFVREQDGEVEMNVAYYLACDLDINSLPRRYRLTHEQEMSLIFSTRVTKREWLKRLAADHAWIDEEPRLRRSDLPAEFTAALRRIYKSNLAKSWFSVDAMKEALKAQQSWKSQDKTPNPKTQRLAPSP